MDVYDNDKEEFLFGNDNEVSGEVSHVGATTSSTSKGAIFTMVMYVSDELDFKIFVIIVLNRFHITIFIIPHFYYGKVRFESSGSLGNEISAFRE